jgi:hypothetical protein|tara:strand:+ start:6811 stop:7053 length:243 start_codon:yes stop_codon:yes gene_type:complete
MDKDEIITDEIFPFDPTPHEDITACIQAVGVIEDLDTVLLSEEEAEMVDKIKRMSLLITYTALKEIFESNHYGNQESPQG